MKKLLMALGLGLIAGVALASTTPKGWLDDLDEAKKQAKESGKPIMVLFTGSDWCPPCMAFKKEVVDKKKFTSQASQKVVLLYVDIPNKGLTAEKKAANQKLLRAYGVQGVPTRLLLDAEGNQKTVLKERRLDGVIRELDKEAEAYQKELKKAAAESPKAAEEK